MQLHDSSVAADIMMYFIFLLFIISDGDKFVWDGHYNIITISLTNTLTSATFYLLLIDVDVEQPGYFFRAEI